MGLGKRYKAKSGWSYRRFPIKGGLNTKEHIQKHIRYLSR